MKGVIRENLGASRYVVGVTSANQPLADEIQKYQDLYDASIPKITDAYGKVNELRAEYQEALDVVNGLIADYELCRLEFSLVDCTSSGNAACEAAYLAADDLCLEIESAPGECDADCQRERLRCQERARSARLACLSQVGIDCTEKQQQHLSECQKTWSPQIAAAQKAALALYPGIQAAMLDLQHELALQWQLAQKLNELEGIQAREHQITCFIAQWNAELAVGTEVEMAKTPNERFVITGIVTAPTPCLHDARVLPSGHLFVNASIAPGSETWRPTWRVGTVKEVLADTLKVEFAPANMPGGLGTIETIRPIDCTPPQCYFDGKDPKAAEADIKAARTALKEAQQALLDAVAVRAECLEEFDQTWFNLCYQGKVEACDSTYGDAIEQAAIDKGACYETATSNCETTVNEGLAACSEQFQPAIDEKQGDVDAAQATLTEATNFLIGKQGDLLAAQQAMEACLIDPEETPESCAEQYQPAIDAAQTAVDAAYTVALNAQIALNNATESLEAAQKDLKDCQDGFVLADCIANAIQLCDDTYQQAQDTYTQQKAACYQEGLADCDRQRDEAIQACYDANAEAIDAAQATVDALTRDLELAMAGVYQPANPLILEVPIAHCQAASYRLDDVVLIDFPVRTGSTAMASWDSRRVIGWAQDTRKCFEYLWIVNHFVNARSYVSGPLTQEVPDGEDAEAVTIQHLIDHATLSDCDQIWDPIQAQWLTFQCPAEDLLFFEWTNDHSRAMAHVAINITNNIGFTAGYILSPYAIYLYPEPGNSDYDEDPEQWYIDGYHGAKYLPSMDKWFLNYRSTREHYTLERLMNPYDEPDYEIFSRVGDWILYGYETPQPIGDLYSDPVIPGTLTVWCNNLVPGPLFLHIQWATYTLVGPEDIGWQYSGDLEINVRAWKFIRTGFGHDGPV